MKEEATPQSGRGADRDRSTSNRDGDAARRPYIDVRVGDVRVTVRNRPAWWGRPVWLVSGLSPLVAVVALWLHR